MSEFWGYQGADVIAIVIISALTIWALYHAREFVSGYHER